MSFCNTCVLRQYKYPPESKIKEECTLKDGLRHAYFSVLGDKYIGDWKRNVKCGKGSHYSRPAKRKLYEGDYDRDLRNGYGVLCHQGEHKKYILDYDGDWLDGKPHALVEYLSATDEVATAYLPLVGARNGFKGYGTMHYIDGGMYDGYWFQGKRQGHGRMWFSYGIFYEGEWYADMRHGLGLCVYKNGNRYEGEWYTDMKHGQGIYYHLDSGQMQTGVWQSDFAVTSTMVDLFYRQSAKEPTPYVIQAVTNV